MLTARHTSWWGDAIRGALAGGVAVWVMDLVTTGLQASQTKESARREAAASPSGQSAVANLVDRVAAMAGVELDESTKPNAEQLAHYALGVVPGAVYGATRRRLPLIGAWRGMAYGAALFVGNDEFLNASLGLSGPIDAYPADSHLRGFVGHLVLGAVTDTAIDILGG